ncbi:hypothetical protein A1O1_06578 [Capronia coronata CBS 617.96]|uniref:Uncharacterized protein n=1 Tax=Capronia coronata CBS 617.96 TaxID=1182541 RepID=W9Y141_9EURO|nr:uncharacterized protein A1O1_06578 [Capronia coronata CBS 617.96]EXJ86208.1 hypothetical protein A1O1_06578 [Capronia coronata CBS 617.96]
MLFKRQSSKIHRPQCSQGLRQRKIVFCDWGFHGRAGNDGWTFTYVDEVDFDPEEDLRLYNKTDPNDCGEILSKFVKKQLRKNSRLKESQGWRFICLIDDGQRRQLPVQRRDRTPRTMLLFERDVSCPCDGRQHQMRESKIHSSEESDGEKRSSISKCEYTISDPPPQYRSRLSTLDTLVEEDHISVGHKV